MRDRTEWTRGEPGPKNINGHVYRNLTEFTRPCANCGKPFSIFVTDKIASGLADSNSFGLRTCPEHRRSKVPPAADETAKLRAMNNTMRQELEGLYARDKAMFAEMQELKARLSTYERNSIVHLVDGVPASGSVLTSVSQKKMPWER